MALLVNLPIQVSMSILTEWIHIRDLSSLDVAFCMHPKKTTASTNPKNRTEGNQQKISRHDYLQILQDSNFVLTEPMYFVKESNNVRYLKWLAKRGIKSNHLLFSMVSLPDIISFDHLNFTKLQEIHFIYQTNKNLKKKKSFLASNDQHQQTSSQQILQFTSNLVGHVLNFIQSSTTSPSSSSTNEENTILPNCLEDAQLLLLSRQLPSSIQKITFCHWKEITNNQLNLLLSKSNLYLKSLNLSKCASITDDSIVLIFQQYYHCLEELNLSCCSSLTGLFFPVIKSLCRRFHQLNLSYCPNITLDNLELFLSEYKELQQFIAEDLSIISNELLETFVTGNEKIQAINVDYCSNVTIDCLNRLLVRKPNLQFFTSKDCTYSRADQHHPSRQHYEYDSSSSSISSSSSSSLSSMDPKELISKELILKGCYTRQSAIIQLLSNFPNDSFAMDAKNNSQKSSAGLHSSDNQNGGREQDWHGLQSINATECRKLGNQSVQIIANKFANSLLSLKLSPWKDIEIDTFQFLFSQCIFLQIINLSYCETITDQVLATSMAMNLHSLKKLYLNHCPLISDEGIIPIIQACPLLTVLELENCQKISNATITNIFQYAVHIQRINVFATGITSECFDAMVFQSPPASSYSSSEQRGGGEEGVYRQDNLLSYWELNENRFSFEMFVSEYWRDSHYWKVYQACSSPVSKALLKRVQFLPTPMYHYHTTSTLNS